MTTTEAALRECPFCGTSEHLHVSTCGSMTSDMLDRPHRVVCDHIDHDQVQGPVGYGRFAAIAAWNRRSQPSPASSTVGEGVLLPRVMTAAMINAWSGGLTISTDENAARSTFQDAWERVIAAAPSLSPSSGKPAKEEPTAKGDRVAGLMRDYFEAHKKDKWDGFSADHLMGGLLNIVRREYRLVEPASVAVEALETFPPETTDVQSRYVIVHRLRASADIQDRQTKSETGWADTTDRAELIRKAADIIEMLAALSDPTAAQIKTVAEWVANMVGSPYSDWRHFTREAEAVLSRLATLSKPTPVAVEAVLDAGNKLAAQVRSYSRGMSGLVDLGKVLNAWDKAAALSKPTPVEAGLRERELIARFRDAVANVPYIIERVAGGQQFNAYESADDDDEEVEDEDREYRLCIGPISNARFIADVEGYSRAQVIEAALKLASHVAFNPAALSETLPSKEGEQ